MATPSCPLCAGTLRVVKSSRGSHRFWCPRCDLTYPVALAPEAADAVIVIPGKLRSARLLRRLGARTVSRCRRCGHTLINIEEARCPACRMRIPVPAHL